MKDENSTGEPAAILSKTAGGTEPSVGSLALLMKFTAPHKGLYALSVVLAVFGVACGFVPYIAVANMALNLLEGGQNFSFFVVWCLIAGLAFVGRAVFSGLSTTVSHRATFKVMSEIRRAIARKLAKLPLGYVLETPSGRLKTSLVERPEQLEVPLAHALPEMTSNLLVPLGIVIVLFVLDWRMALAALVTIPVGILCYAVEMREYPKKYGEVVRARNHMSAAIVEYINGIEVIKTFNQSSESYGKFTDAVKGNSGLMLDWMKATLPWTAIMLSVWPSVLVGVLPVGCLLFMDGSLDAVKFITIIVMSLGIIGPLLSAVMFTDDLAKMSTIVGQIGETLVLPDMVRPTEAREVRDYSVALDRVSFSYGEAPVLREVSLEVAEGSMLALVGPSGSGKSTVAKLIVSFWDASSGEVSIGGCKVADIPLEQIGDLVAYVSQDSYLFNDSVRNNIRMGSLEATDEDIEAIAKASGCHDFIMQLEDGYETAVGGSGSHLSGGERQRIAIARAMVKNAPIVVLDEATAYTDPENEAVIQDAVARLTQGKTLIVIAHRLSTIVDADAIAVIDAGKVVACATHDELLASSSLYKKMWLAHSEARDAV